MIHIRLPQSIAGLLSETAREGVMQTVETSGTASICYNLMHSSTKLYTNHREEHKFCKSGSDLLTRSQPPPLCIQGEEARKVVFKEIEYTKSCLH
jgi:hypothetical protein